MWMIIQSSFTTVTLTAVVVGTHRNLAGNPEVHFATVVVAWERKQSKGDPTG